MKKLFAVCLFLSFMEQVYSQSNELYFLKYSRLTGTATGEDASLVSNHPANLAKLYYYGMDLQYQHGTIHWHHIRNNTIFYIKNFHFAIQSQILIEATKKKKNKTKWHFQQINIAMAKTVKKFSLGFSVGYERDINHYIENNQYSYSDIISTNIGFIYPIISQSNNIIFKKLKIAFQIKPYYNMQQKKFNLFLISGLSTKLLEWENKFSLSLKIDIFFPHHFLYIPLSLGISVKFFKHFSISFDFYGDHFFQFEKIFFSFLFEYKLPKFYTAIQNSNRIISNNQKTSVVSPDIRLALYYTSKKSLKKHNDYEEKHIQEKYFSPNQDGIQDYAKITIPNQYQSYHLYIKNIQNNKIFSLESILDNKSQQSFTWYGKNSKNKVLPDGLYFIHLKKNKEENSSILISKVTIDTQPPIASYTIGNSKDKNEIPIIVKTEDDLLYAECTIYNPKKEIIFLEKKEFINKKELIFTWKTLKKEIYHFDIKVVDRAGNSAFLKKNKNYWYFEPKSNNKTNNALLVSKQYLSTIELFSKGIDIMIHKKPLNNSVYFLEIVDSSEKVLLQKKIDDNSFFSYTYKSNVIFPNQKIYVNLVENNPYQNTILKSKSVVLHSISDRGNIFFQENIFFKSNSTKIIGISFIRLKKIYDKIQKQNFCSIQIKGYIHHVRRGNNYNYGYSLSLKRAKKIKNYFFKQYNSDKNNKNSIEKKYSFYIKGMGANNQNSLNNPKKNRRGELKINCLRSIKQI